jgi:hypothetical protein
MHRTRVMTGILGVVLAAGAVHAADVTHPKVPATITLFGQKYNVAAHTLGGTYANGVKITQSADWDTGPSTNKTKVDFVQGATPDKDRLFVATATSQDAAVQPKDQLYLLTGSDATTGDFNTTVSKATQYFGGAVDYTVGGRPTDVLWLNDTDTGVKKDKNIIIVQFTDDDHYRFYDLDSLATGTFRTDEVGFQENHIIKGVGTITNPEDPNNDGSNVAAGFGDPNAPFTGFMTFARTANPQYLLATAQPDSASVTTTNGVEMGIMDLKTTNFLPILTNVTATAGSLPQHDDGSGNQVDGTPHALNPEAFDPATMLPTSNVYWMLYTDAQPGGNSFTLTSNQLVRIQIDLPADVTKGKPGDIKVKTLGLEDMMKSGLSDVSVDSNNMIMGVSIGRETTPGSGKHIVYLSDWDGNLLTLTPQ